MGSGKSFVGRNLPMGESWLNLDMDHVLEEKFGMTIKEYFSINGENAFRKEEMFVLQELTNRKEKIIVSTGGGTPCFFENMSYMLKNGIVIYLECSIDGLVQKILKGIEKRPLLTSKPLSELKLFIEELLETRRPIYEQAHITVDGDMDFPDKSKYIIDQLNLI
jgi:shikimate kinase